MCPNCLPTSYDIVFCYLASCVEGCLDSSIPGLFFERELLQLDYADSRVASLVGYLEWVLICEIVIEVDRILERIECKLACGIQKRDTKYEQAR